MSLLETLTLKDQLLAELINNKICVSIIDSTYIIDHKAYVKKSFHNFLNFCWDKDLTASIEKLSFKYYILNIHSKGCKII